MGDDKGKFVCPHCNEVMDVDMIYLHVRKIFNGALHKCCECDFSTNDTFHRDHHKSITGHKFEGKKDLNPLLEDAISSTATMFMNSVIDASEKAPVVRTIKPKNTEKLSNSKQSNDNIQTPVITSSGKRTFDSDSKRRLFSNTIISINTMSFEYERESKIPKASKVVEVSLGGRLPTKKYNVPLPTFDKNKTTTCRICQKEVSENYLDRRKHIFKDHQEDIMNSLVDLKTFKKTDILFNGFRIIRDCFPDQIVCTDFQCIDCGFYYSSSSGVKYHVGVFHQKSVMINCPFDNCDFKTGSSCHAKDHIRTHIKGIVGSKNDVSKKNLVSYVSAQNYATFDISCKSGIQIIKHIEKHYFPISTSYYDNFQNDFKEALGEFKKCYLQPYVLNDLTYINQGVNEIELDPSLIEVNEESEEEIEQPERSMLKKKNISSKKKRKHSDSSSSVSDIIFLKEVTPKLKKNTCPDNEINKEGSVIKDNIPNNTYKEIIIKESSEESVENDKVSKFTKEIPPFESVTGNFFQNTNDCKLKEELVCKVDNNLDKKKIKSEYTSVSSEGKSNTNHKDFVYETFSKNEREYKWKSRQEDTSRERSQIMNQSYNKDDDKKHSSESRYHNNSSKYFKSSYNHKNSSYR